jgi:hypothetical protein
VTPRYTPLFPFFFGNGSLPLSISAVFFLLLAYATSFTRHADSRQNKTKKMRSTLSTVTRTSPSHPDPCIVASPGQISDGIICSRVFSLPLLHRIILCIACASNKRFFFKRKKNAFMKKTGLTAQHTQAQFL